MRNFIYRALSKLERLDIEQIKALVQELVTENDKLESSLHSLNAGILVIDTTGIITFSNTAIKRLIPILKNDIIDTHYVSAINDKEIVDLIKKSEVNEETIHDSEIAIDSPGKTKIISVSILPLLLHGEISGSLVYIRDITEKKHANARLRRAESLASLTTMTAGMAHEIKNPLGSIGIHIQLMQKALNREKACKKEFLEKNLNILSEEVERLNGIVVDFLFAVRPMDVDLKEKKLESVIKETLELVKPELDENNIKLELSTSKNLPNIQMDDKLLKQAILNIIKNAINAMPEGGHLSIEQYKEHDNLILQIKDDGDGIPEENLEKIFEPYFTTKDFGSGLGLTLVYKIIKEHNGEINIKSKVGIGSLFIIKLPIPQKEKHLLGWRGKNNGL